LQVLGCIIITQIVVLLLVYGPIHTNHIMSASVLQGSQTNCVIPPATVLVTVPPAPDQLDNLPALSVPCISDRNESHWFYIDETVEYKCDIDRANQFINSNAAYAKSKKYRKSLQDANLDNLRRTKKVLDSLNVPFFLSHGALLGWYRECSVIAHTSDMDVGIPYIYMSNNVNKIKDEMAKQGFKLIYWYGELEKGYELSFRRRNYNIDLFTFYKDVVRVEGKETEYLWNSMWWQQRLLRRMAFPVTDFVWTYLLDMRVLVPKKALDWIIADYGPSWNVPKDSTWEWWASPANYIDEQVIRENHMEAEMVKYGQNLVKNPSFEQFEKLPNGKYDIKNWSIQSGIVSISGDAHTGRASLQCFNPNVTNTCVITQDVPLRLPYEQKGSVLIAGWSKKLKKEAKNWSWSNNYCISYTFVATAPGGVRQNLEAGNFVAEFGVQKEGWQYSSYEVDWPAFFNSRRPVQVDTVRVKVTFNSFTDGALFDEIAVRRDATCPDNCNGRGTCIYGVCHCFVGSAGSTCEQGE